MRALLLMLLASQASAAPFLVSEQIDADAVSMTVNGGAAVPCAIVANVPKCDLAGITAPGTYTLVMIATRNAGIVNAPNAGTVTQSGAASSAPFTYVLRGASVPTPVLRVAP